MPDKPVYRKMARDYARLYGVDERTIKRWKKKEWPLDDPEAMRGLVGSQKHTTSNLRAESTVEKKNRKLDLENEKLAFQNAVARGHYTANAQIREDITAIATAMRAALLRLENDLPGELAGLDETAIQGKLRERFDGIFAQLSSSTSDLYPAPAPAATLPCTSP